MYQCWGFTMSCWSCYKWWKYPIFPRFHWLTYVSAWVSLTEVPGICPKDIFTGFLPFKATSFIQAPFYMILASCWRGLICFRLTNSFARLSTQYLCYNIYRNQNLRWWNKNLVNCDTRFYLVLQVQNSSYQTVKYGL